VQIEQEFSNWNRAYDEMYQSNPSTSVTRAEFVWALSCVTSRAFSGPMVQASFKERLWLFVFAAWAALGYWILSGSQEQAVNILVYSITTVLAYDFIYPRVLQAQAGIDAKQYILSPVIDFCNHKSSVQSDVSFEYFYDQYALRTQGCAKGDALFINYGRRSNDQLLMYYGFIEADNPYEEHLLAESGVGELIEEYSNLLPRNFSKERTEMLMESNLLELGKVVYSRDGLNTNAKIVLRALLCTAEEFGDGSDVIIKFRDGGEVSSQTEESVTRFIRAILRHELDEFPTTLEQDIYTYQNLDVNAPSFERLPLQYRIEKKRFLNSACNANSRSDDVETVYA